MAEEKKGKGYFFVGIHEEDEIKQNISEAMQGILHSLQKYEGFVKVRLEKNRAISDLKMVFKEIETLAGKLKVAFPKSSMANVQNLPKEDDVVDLGKKKEDEIEKELPAKVKTSSKKVKKEDINALEGELSKIEDRLKGI